MSAAAATEVDAHSRRITAAKWFEGVEGAEICDVLVTAALDGTVFVQTFFDGALGPRRSRHAMDFAPSKPWTRSRRAPTAARSLSRTSSEISNSGAFV